MSESQRIRLTGEELEKIVQYFERDRAQITARFGADEDADFHLQILKTFQKQILENQDIADRVTQRKDYHSLCKSRFEKGSDMAKFHHYVWQELNNVENG